MKSGSNDLFSGHRGKIIGGLVGFILALLFIFLGFWKTILIVIFVLLGIYLGNRTELFRELHQLLLRIWHGGAQR